MKALAYNPNSKETSFLQLVDIAKPKLINNNAIIKVLGVGVCGSDLLKLNQGLVKPGAILGHEMVGIIDEISSEMSSLYNLKQGDRIISSHHVPCLECDYCLRGQESLCTQFKSTNFNPGAFCEYLELSENHLKHTVYKLPSHLSDEEASFVEPVACCIKAAERSAISQSSIRVLVIGLGSIGLIMGQVVKHSCPNAEVTGLDLIEDRLKLAQALGFDNAISSLSHSATQSPNYFDYIFLCAGNSSTVDLAIKHAKPGATIIVFSSVTDASKAFTNNDIYYKELTVLGRYSPNLSNLKESLELISSGIIKIQKLITQDANLENLGENIKLCSANQGIKTYLSMK
jgi:L-iditol 2-dehydrogenase